MADSDRARRLVRAASGRMALTEDAAKEVLACFGLRVPRRVVLPEGAPIGDALAGLVPPFVVKVVAPTILHKTDVGGVQVGLPDTEAVAQVLGQMRLRLAGHSVEGWLVEEMAPAGVEMVVGGGVDARFGPYLMLGLGGIMVELFEDVRFGICPLRPGDVANMLDRLRAVRLLRGFRGAKPADEAAIIQAVLQVGGPGGLMMTLANEVAELDINPLIVGAGGAVAVDARIVLHRDQPGREDSHTSDNLSRLFAPNTIAVIGASASSGGVAVNFLRNLRELGFPGRVWAVHPTAAEIEGWPAVPTIAALPELVDYAYVSVAAARTPTLLREASGRIRFVQVISSGFAEAGEPALEAELLDACRIGGMRLLGPNCLGLYSARQRISFIGGVSTEPGGVAVLSQSGGLGADILRRGQVRGLRFASLLTLGNSADLGPAELLRPLFDDPDVTVIGLYLEDVKDGRAFFETLRTAAAAKPVVILKGGQTEAGQRASASHTGALAQDGRLWDALSAQTGAVIVETLDRFLDALLAFQCLRPRPDPSRSVVLFGNGGGTSVLATDAFSRAGFLVPPLEGSVLEQLQALRLPPGSSVVNPIDTPAGTLRSERGALGGRILALLGAAPGIDAIVVHLNIPVILAYADPKILPNLIHGALAARHAGGPHLVFVLRTDGELLIEAQRQEYRAICLSKGVPVYAELAEAAEALRCLAFHEQFRRQVR